MRHHARWCLHSPPSRRTALSTAVMRSCVMSIIITSYNPRELNKEVSSCERKSAGENLQKEKLSLWRCHRWLQSPAFPARPRRPRACKPAMSYVSGAICAKTCTPLPSRTPTCRFFTALMAELIPLINRCFWAQLISSVLCGFIIPWVIYCFYCFCI